MKRRKMHDRLDAIARKASSMHIAELNVNGTQVSDTTRRAIECGVVSGIALSANVVGGDINGDDEHLASAAMSVAARVLVEDVLGGGDGE